LNKYDEFSRKTSQPIRVSSINNDISKESDYINIKDNKFENYNVFNYVIEPNKNLPTEVIEFMKFKCFSESADNINKYYEENQEIFPLIKSIYIGQIKLKENGVENLFEFYLRIIKLEDDSYMEFMLNNVTYTQIQEIEKTKQKTQILARITHEFKNPLIVSSEVIEEIEDDQTISEETKHNLKFLKNLSLYMLILVKDFEVISNIENKVDNTIYPVNVDLKEFIDEIQEIVEALIKKKNSIYPLKFLVTIDRGLEVFRTDIMRLKQILINLISNSIKFTELGFIELKIERIRDQFDYNSYNNADVQGEEFKKIKISVIDSGKGISIEKQNDLFNSVIKEYSDSNILGTGYGLGIVKNLCKMLGSDIRYTENNPRGSIFYFILPESNKKEENKYSNIDDINILKNQNELLHNTDDQDITSDKHIFRSLKNLNLFTRTVRELRNISRKVTKKITNKTNLSSKFNSKISNISQGKIETTKKIFELNLPHSIVNSIKTNSQDENESKKL